MKSLRISPFALLVAVAALWLLGGATAWACPNCGEAMASDPAQAGLVRGIFWSILLLLSMPFLILGGLGGYFYWLVRNAQRVAAERAEQAPFAEQRDYSPAPRQLETAAHR